MAKERDVKSELIGQSVPHVPKLPWIACESCPTVYNAALT